MKKFSADITNLDKVLTTSEKKTWISNLHRQVGISDLNFGGIKDERNGKNKGLIFQARINLTAF